MRILAPILNLLPLLPVWTAVNPFIQSYLSPIYVINAVSRMIVRAFTCLEQSILRLFKSRIWTFSSRTLILAVLRRLVRVKIPVCLDGRSLAKCVPSS
ncbi:hypothetical protein BDQ17DRAFT_647665 [Cyathus striatus]|nr:hypothetical protein BDQ17DRAFT_647665 [Cyathus striatus]